MNNINKIIGWKKYREVEGYAEKFSYRIIRAYAKIEGRHFINNFVDYIENNAILLRSLDKVIIISDNDPIVLIPKYADDCSTLTNKLKSFKNTNVKSIVLAMGEEGEMKGNGFAIEDILIELNARTEIEVKLVVGN